MKHLDLFSGILGNALAAKWCWGDEYENVGFCEIDPFCQSVIRKLYPNAKIFPDIKTIDPDEIGTVDLITAGVPCQPASTAGKRKGREDDRWLWPRTLEIVRALKPRIAVFENPDGILSLEGGVPLEYVFSEMEAYGYETVPVIIPAASVGAPHLRYRLWIVAYANGVRQPERREESGFGGGSEDCSEAGKQTEKRNGFDDVHQIHSVAAHAHSDGYWRSHELGEDSRSSRATKGKENQWQRIRTVAGGNNPKPADTRGEESSRLSGIGREEVAAVRGGDKRHSDALGVGWELPRPAREWRPGLAHRNPREWPQIVAELCPLDDGLSNRLVRLPDGRKISGKTWRKEALKAIGNSVDPFVPYQIFKAIKAVDI